MEWPWTCPYRLTRVGEVARAKNVEEEQEEKLEEVDEAEEESGGLQKVCRYGPFDLFLDDVDVDIFALSTLTRERFFFSPQLRILILANLMGRKGGYL